MTLARDVILTVGMAALASACGREPPPSTAESLDTAVPATALPDSVDTVFSADTMLRDSAYEGPFIGVPVPDTARRR